MGTPTRILSSQLVSEESRGLLAGCWALWSALTKKEAAKAVVVVPFSLRFTGIQKNVQALCYILNHPLVYRDAKPRLDSLQKPYVPRKKVKGAASEGRTAPLVMLVSGSVPELTAQLWGGGKLIQYCLMHQ